MCTIWQVACVLQWVYHWHVIMSQEHAANVQSLSSHVTTLYFKTWEFPSSRKSVHVMFVCTDSPHHTHAHTVPHKHIYYALSTIDLAPPTHILYHILSTYSHYWVRSTRSTPYRTPWLTLHTGWHAWTHTTEVRSTLYVCISCDKDPEAGRADCYQQEHSRHNLHCHTNSDR